VPKSCQLSAALIPAAGAHCNITDICLARAISAPATQRMSSNRSEMNLGNAATSVGASVCVPAFFRNEGGDRHAQPHRGSMIKVRWRVPSVRRRRETPECPSENQFREPAKLMPWISGQSAPDSRHGKAWRRKWRRSGMWPRSFARPLARGRIKSNPSPASANCVNVGGPCPTSRAG
jgi:hypothetical protein